MINQEMLQAAASAMIGDGESPNVWFVVARDLTVLAVVTTSEIEAIDCAHAISDAYRVEDRISGEVWASNLCIAEHEAIDD